MFTFVALLTGMIAVIGFNVLRPYVSKQANKPWVAWAAIVVWYLWTIAGISFVLINAFYKHAKPATIGAFFFFVISIAGAILLARMLGLIKATKSKSVAS